MTVARELAAPDPLQALETFYRRPAARVLADPEHLDQHEILLDALESGALRAATKGPKGRWQAQAWVKTAILLGFRGTQTESFSAGALKFVDKAGFPARSFGVADDVRIVPGGSSVRRGAHLGSGVVIMPPAYVNVGAWVGEGSMVDSHALVGSCAQIGERVHLAAGAQIGGVLEPPGAVPVVVEDEAFVGANTGVFEGVVVRQRAVLGAGVQLTASTRVFDLVRETTSFGEIPEGAVVVPGSRRLSGVFAAANGLAAACAVIVKYRDAGTDAATALEGALR